MRKTIFFLILTAALAAPPLASAQNAVSVASAPNCSASMARLQEAAQRLSESVQAMAQHPPGE